MDDALPLSRLFLAQAGLSAPADLEQELRALWDTGRAAWPGVDVPAAELARHLGGRLPPGQAPKDMLDRLAAADVYLACGCALGLATAAPAFEQTFLSRVGAMLAPMRLSPDEVDEVRQRVRERVLVAAPGKSPKIASYSGAGPLGGWLRAVVLRTALNFRRERGAGPPAADQDLLDALPFTDHRELEYIKRRHREDVLRALQEAFASLSQEQRNVLRLHYAGGLPGERIAALLGKSRATIVRWLAAARETMLCEVRRRLQERLGLPAGELDSFIGLMRSRLDLSIGTLLRDREE